MKAGSRGEAESIFARYLPLIRYENQPIIKLTLRKEMLYRRGAIAHPTLRPPFTAISAGTLDEIGWVFARVGITDPTAKIVF